MHQKWPPFHSLWSSLKVGHSVPGLYFFHNYFPHWITQNLDGKHWNIMKFIEFFFFKHDACSSILNGALSCSLGRSWPWGLPTSASRTGGLQVWVMVPGHTKCFLKRTFCKSFIKWQIILINYKWKKIHACVFFIFPFCHAHVFTPVCLHGKTLISWPYYNYHTYQTVNNFFCDLFLLKLSNTLIQKHNP